MSRAFYFRLASLAAILIYWIRVLIVEGDDQFALGIALILWAIFFCTSYVLEDRE